VDVLDPCIPQNSPDKRAGAAIGEAVDDFGVDQVNVLNQCAVGRSEQPGDD